MSDTMVTYQACDYSDWDETINFTQFITIRTTIFTYLICVNIGAIFSPVKAHEKMHKFATKYPKLAKILRSLCKKEHRLKKEYHLCWRWSQILAMHFHICINHQLSIMAITALSSRLSEEKQRTKAFKVIYSECLSIASSERFTKRLKVLQNICTQHESQKVP